MSEAFFIYQASVLPSWIDYNNHMGDYAYGIIFSNAATAYMNRIGIDASYREMNSATLYTLDSRIGYLKECHVHDLLNVELSVIDMDRKRMHLFMRILNEKKQEIALCEQLLMHVSRIKGTPYSANMPQPIQDKLLADYQLSKSIEKPKWIEGRIGLR